MNSAYQRDGSTGVWRRSGFSGLQYSDGDRHEEYLRSVIGNAADVSSWSPELIAAIRDWPSEYHLSPVRHNLLRPFDFGPDHAVLELGGGCGAMTRYLGERAGRVVCVEGSARRAEIAALRCRDLASVEVYCDALDGFDTDERFDFVLLIGVLEYATKYGQGDDPALDCLRNARRFLKPGGQLVLAIENKLGLKYFAGCGEDHNGIPFYGVSGLYRGKDVETYGRRQLLGILEGAGFGGVSFYYPFPDYKVPSVVLSERALSDSTLCVPDLLLSVFSRDYVDDRYRAFDEGLVFESLHANGLVGDLSNSFLVLAGIDALPDCGGWLAKMYGRSVRRREFAKETEISRRVEDGVLVVTKSDIFNSESGGGAAYVNEYICGRLVLAGVRRAIAANADLREIANAFRPWVDFLVANSREVEGRGLVVPSNFVDCTPFNLIVREHDGVCEYFDDEWSGAGEIPLVWVFVRGVVYSARSAMCNSFLDGMSSGDFAIAVGRLCGISVSSEDVDLTLRMERDFHARVYGDNPNPLLAGAVGDAFHGRLYLKTSLRRHDGDEVARMKATLSWRMTGPFRALANLFRR